MRPLGVKIDINKTHRNPLNNTDETWTKYGIEQKIHDFIQEGREGTEANEIIKKAGNINALPHVQEILKDNAEKEILNMNLDPFVANRIMKMGAIAERKLKEQQAAAEAAAAAQTAQQQNEPKGDNK